MSPTTTARLLRLYPSHWRERYGAEFTALLEDHPLSFKTLFDIMSAALEAHMTSFNSAQRQGAALNGVLWCAWMLAVAAGMILYGVVDDSLFVGAMGSSSLLRSCWLGIELGAVIAAAAITLGGAPVAWSMLRYAVIARRRDILLRLALPLLAAVVLVGWIGFVSFWTGGHWGASPWAVALSRPDWPSESFRWITGSISTFLLLLLIASSALAIAQALRRSKFPEVRLSFPGAELRIDPLRFAALLAPWAAVGSVVMFVSVAAWGLAAGRNAADVLHKHFVPLGLTSFSAWLVSVFLFAAAATLSVSVARRSRALRFDME
jgi:hypothetical protein